MLIENKLGPTIKLCSTPKVEDEKVSHYDKKFSFLKLRNCLNFICFIIFYLIFKLHLTRKKLQSD